MIVECIPEAEVAIDGQKVGSTPFTGKIRWEREEIVRRIQVRAADYESKEIAIPHLTAKDAPNPWRYAITLDRISHALPIKVSTNPAGAALTINDHSEGMSPREVVVRFSRDSGKGVWNSAQIKANLPNYLTKAQSISYAEAQRGAVHLDLDEIRRELAVVITSTPDKAEVSQGGKVVGATPCTISLEFTRERGNLPWSQQPIQVSKSGHRWKRPGGPVAPGDISSFSSSITLEEAMSGRIHIDFEPIQYVQTRLRRLVFTPEGAELQEEMHLAQVSDGETSPNVDPPTQISRAASGALHDTRIWVVPGTTDVIYCLPIDPDDVKNPLYNLWMITTAGQTRLTNEPYRDVEPCVSADAKSVCFSSNRLHSNKERTSLHVIALSGRAGLPDLQTARQVTLTTILHFRPTAIGSHTHRNCSRANLMFGL